MSLLPDYSNQARTYDETRAASPSVLGPLREALEGAPGRRLVDIGGGTGNYSRALRDEGWDPIVVDREPGMLERAAAKGLETVQGDAQRLPLPDACADAAMLVSMLHHVEDPAAAIAEAKRVEIFGLGSSGTAAREMAFRLERIRVPVWHRTDSHTALTNAALLGPGDVAIGLSHSGRTREAIETLAEAADHGALTVAVTSFGRSPLAEVADVVFTTSVHETTFRVAALSALHSQLLVLDLIYVAVAQRTYERTAEALELTVRAVEAHRVPETTNNRKRPRREKPL